MKEEENDDDDPILMPFLKRYGVTMEEARLIQRLSLSEDEKEEVHRDRVVWNAHCKVTGHEHMVMEMDMNMNMNIELKRCSNNREEEEEECQAMALDELDALRAIFDEKDQEMIVCHDNDTQMTRIILRLNNNNVSE